MPALTTKKLTGTGKSARPPMPCADTGVAEMVTAVTATAASAPILAGDLIGPRVRGERDGPSPTPPRRCRRHPRRTRSRPPHRERHLLCDRRSGHEPRRATSAVTVNSISVSRSTTTWDSPVTTPLRTSTTIAKGPGSSVDAVVVPGTVVGGAVVGADRGGRGRARGSSRGRSRRRCCRSRGHNHRGGSRRRGRGYLARAATSCDDENGHHVLLYPHHLGTG